jgi:hypothetical protein
MKRVCMKSVCPSHCLCGGISSILVVTTTHSQFIYVCHQINDYMTCAMKSHGLVSDYYQRRMHLTILVTQPYTSYFCSNYCRRNNGISHELPVPYTARPHTDIPSHMVEGTRSEKNSRDAFCTQQPYSTTTICMPCCLQNKIA